MKLYYEKTKEEAFDALMAKCSAKGSQYRMNCEEDTITVFPREKTDKIKLRYEGKLKAEGNGCAFVGKIKYDRISFFLLLGVALVCLALMVYMIVVKNTTLTFVYLSFVLILGGATVRIYQLTKKKIDALKSFLNRV
ncbi:MAG: hypothetical protein J5993_04405 [Clostridia bacterium]|nr:hypothetical protein [Clostridia bacterium]